MIIAAIISQIIPLILLVKSAIKTNESLPIYLASISLITILIIYFGLAGGGDIIGIGLFIMLLLLLLFYIYFVRKKNIG
jgi:hypothetical protein